MKAKIISCGILAYRVLNGKKQVFLVHPGGPFWAKKDEGAWSIPKGEMEEDETDFLEVAKREFTEETGQEIQGDFISLEPVKLKSGKTVIAFAINNDSIDENSISSKTFEMEWPPRSGKMQPFPEIDRGAWIDIDTAKTKLNSGQLPLLTQLESLFK